MGILGELQLEFLWDHFDGQKLSRPERTVSDNILLTGLRGYGNCSFRFRVSTQSLLVWRRFADVRRCRKWFL